MEFGIEKCTMLIRESGKQHMTNGMDLLNQGKIRTFGEKESYKYFGILEGGTIRVSQENKKAA